MSAQLKRGVGYPTFDEKMSLMTARRTILPIGLLFQVVLLGLNVSDVTKKVWAQTGQDRPLSQKEPPTNSWKGLVPLRSTREEVEKLLGKSKMSHGFTYIYENENQRVNVLYSAGPCELSGVERWNIAKDVVIWMEVTPGKSVLIKDLHLDQKKYRRFQWSHPENWVDYFNMEEGVIVHSIDWGRGEELAFFEYRPTPKDVTFRCK